MAKIALFHSGFIYSGGGERIVLEEAWGLIGRGHEVVVYAPTVDAKNCYPELIGRLPVKMFLPSFLGRLPLRNAIRMTATSLLAPFLAAGFKDIDVFIGANQPGAWLAFCISRMLNKPYLVYLNQPNRIIYPRPVDLAYGWATTVKDYQFLYRIFRLVRPLLAYLDKVSIASARAVLSNGSYISGVIENVYGLKTRVLPAGAGIKSRSRLNSQPQPYLLISGRHDPQKRFDYVIKALAKLLPEFPRLRLVIPGPFTAHTRELVRLCRRLKLDGRVDWLGPVSEAKLQQLYRSALVHCYPSPEEDFGLGPLEAGAWAVPTVAWNHAGPTVTIEAGVTGLLAKPYDLNDYAAKLKQLVASPPLRNRLGRAAYRRVRQQFSWRKHLDGLEKEIRKVVT